MCTARNAMQEICGVFAMSRFYNPFKDNAWYGQPAMHLKTLLKSYEKRKASKAKGINPDGRSKQGGFRALLPSDGVRVL